MKHVFKSNECLLQLKELIPFEDNLVDLVKALSSAKQEMILK